MKSPRRMFTLHSTGSPTAVVLEEILPSPVEHDTSDPAGINCWPESANSGGTHSRESTMRVVRFIISLHNEDSDGFLEPSCGIDFQDARLTANPEMSG